MHVRGLYGHRFDLPRCKLTQLLLLLLVPGTVVGRRPGGLRKRVLLVPHQSCKSGVEFAEPAVETEDRERLRNVVEAVARLAVGRLALAPEVRRGRVRAAELGRLGDRRATAGGGEQLLEDLGDAGVAVGRASAARRAWPARPRGGR